MKGNIEWLKDNINQNYLGIKIDKNILDPYLNELKEHLENNYDTFINNRIDRDGLDNYYITVINTKECIELSNDIGIDNFNEVVQKILTMDILDIKLLGLGLASVNENTSYFIICDSKHINEIRRIIKLSEKDLHITLGFKWNDVSNVNKSTFLQKKSKFLKLLEKEYYNNQNWNFIRQIDNYDMNQRSEIIPVKLNKTSIKFKVDDTYIDVLWLNDVEKFWIVCQYSIDSDLPRLSQNEINKYFKNN